MSKPHRCPTCAHPPGPRNTSNLSKSSKGESEGGHAKKPSCACACHEQTAR